jgi:hypothetical protein
MITLTNAEYKEIEKILRNMTWFTGQVVGKIGTPEEQESNKASLTSNKEEMISFLEAPPRSMRDGNKMKVIEDAITGHLKQEIEGHSAPNWLPGEAPST